MSLPGMENCAVNDPRMAAVRPTRVFPQLSHFPGRTHDIIRFGDLDARGHVNNAVFATFFETGRVAFLREPGNALSPPGTTSVLARLDISFLKELHWPGEVEIGTGIAEIGRSSIPRAAASPAPAPARLVMTEGDPRRSRPLPDEALARLEMMKLREQIGD